MDEPKRIWWARPRKLCALERPGGGGRSHRPERRRHDIEYLKACGVHTVISTMKTRHNLEAYEEAGLDWVHVPVEGDGDGVEQVLRVLRRKLRRAGAVAIHANRRTDFVALVCAAYLADAYDIPLEEGLARAAEAGLSTGR
jgi:hypothetical protein